MDITWSTSSTAMLVRVRQLHELLTRRRKRADDTIGHLQGFGGSLKILCGRAAEIYHFVTLGFQTRFLISGVPGSGLN